MDTAPFVLVAALGGTQLTPAAGQKLTLIAAAILVLLLVVVELGRRGDKRKIVEQDRVKALRDAGKPSDPVELVQYAATKAGRQMREFRRLTYKYARRTK